MKLKKLLKESKVWERKFGEPLPTFISVMEKHSGKKIDEQGVINYEDFYINKKPMLGITEKELLFGSRVSFHFALDE